ncbi:NADH dehydrogenase [Phakopsora pachyrhizi]|nr:NADH dehydrogenase [Phakopsora pachyrhizi]
MLLSFAVSLLALLAYDATTYSERHVKGVPVQPLALNPNRGGPKNLRIAEFLVGDQEDSERENLTRKPKLVIVGGGWGSVGLIKALRPDNYHVVVIAPENYNLFTPLLPSATVGTVETRSLIEPLRKILARVKGHYLQGNAVDVDFGERLVEVKGSDESEESFYVPYDKLIISVGSVSNSHGVPGLEHASQLKTIHDVREIRQKIINNFERAALPSVKNEEERKRLLSFVVCGGGPTGVEFASELYDMINEDVIKYFPKLLRSEVSIHLIQSRDHILNTYSEKISQYAENRFLKAEINTVLSNLTRVKEITPSSVTYTSKLDKREHTIPASFVLWSTGIAMNPLTSKLAGYLPNQYHKHALEVDSHLRVKGAPLGTVYAIGDASTIETNLVNHLLNLVDQCDTNKDGKIDFEEFESMIKQVRRKFPTAQVHIEKVRDVFEKYDSDHDNTLGLNELEVMFKEISNRLTTLPATAQVAQQQGKYLAKKFNQFQARNAIETIQKNDIAESDVDDILSDPFKYRHLGSLAYIGNSAVFDFGEKYGSFGGGLIAAYLVKYHFIFFLKISQIQNVFIDFNGLAFTSLIFSTKQWRSVYWSEQVSTRTRVLLMIDWIKRGIWGRDISKVRVYLFSMKFVFCLIIC